MRKANYYPVLLIFPTSEHFISDPYLFIVADPRQKQHPFHFRPNQTPLDHFVKRQGTPDDE